MCNLYFPLYDFIRKIRSLIRIHTALTVYALFGLQYNRRLDKLFDKLNKFISYTI